MKMGVEWKMCESSVFSIYWLALARAALDVVDAMYRSKPRLPRTNRRQLKTENSLQLSRRPLQPQVGQGGVVEGVVVIAVGLHAE